MEKERFSSRLGFILISAGCAIGLGNVWRFPFIAGKNGGAIFVIIYLLFLLLLGIPIMTAEFAIGRASQTSCVKAFKVLEKPTQKWSFLGISSLLGCYILMFFYTVIGGWILNYIIKMVRGDFHVANAASDQIFGTMLSSPLSMFLWTLLTVFIGFGICFLGFTNGVEKITKFMMLALFALIIILAVNSLMLPNAMEGLKFYLVPNFEQVNAIGWKTVIFEAMNQAFFTLSLGIGAIAIFGSRIGRTHSLFGEAIRVSALDTIIAIAAGLIIFPAASSFNITMDAGPSLVFLTLPQVFTVMPGGRIFGTLFFIFLSFAALSTIIAVFENIISCFTDLFKTSRKKSIIINFFIVLVFSLPCILGFNLLSFIEPLGSGTNFLDLEDFIVSSNLLPLGSLGYLLFAVSRFGWGQKKFFEEVNTGKGAKLPYWSRHYLRYILPLGIILIWVIGYIDRLAG